MKSNLFSTFHKHKDVLVRLISLLFIFGILKSLVYFAPLAINDILGSIKGFGAFEYTLNLGQTFMGIFSMGFAGAYAYFILKLERESLKPVFHFHFIVLTSILLLVAIISPSLLSNSYFGAIVLGVAFADQLLLASILKLAGKNNSSVLIDTGVYIVMMAIAVCVYFKLFSFSSEIWIGSILFSLVITSVFYHSKQLVNYNLLKKSEVIELYKYGGLIVIAGPLLFLVTTNTRIFLSFFTTDANVGIYSFYFRLSSFVLIFYRVIGILLYRKMFTAEHKQLDKFFSLIIICVFCVNVILFLALPFVLTGRYEQFTSTIEEYRGLFLLCLFQVTFWINVALLEPVLQRENKIKQFILVLVICLIIFITSLFALDYFNCISLENIVALNTVIIFLTGLGQHMILRKLGAYYKRTLIVHMSIAFLFLTALYFC